MKIEPFELERWLLNSCEIDLGGAGVTKLKLKEVVTSIDYDRLMKYGAATNGSETLRKAIADWFPGVEAENVLVTSATSEANLLCNLRVLKAGDEYVAEYPCYTQSVGFAKSLGCKIRKFYLDEKNDWRPDLKRLNEIVTKRTKIIFFDNPNNPTGAMLTDDEMRTICEIAENVGAYVVCDNALRGSEFDGKLALTPFGYYDKVVVTGSISKLGMTDPRIGWLIADKEFVKSCWKFKDYTTLSHSALGEYLAIEALQEKNRLDTIKRNLQFSQTCLALLSQFIDENNRVLSWVPPNAGFTAFPKYDSQLTSEEFCKNLLREEKLLISPGQHFGLDKHLRINIGSAKGIMTEGLERLRRFMKNLTD